MFPFSSLQVEYSNFHRSSQIMSNALSMSNSGFPHSWIVSGQDFCPITYSSIQGHNSGVSSNLATVEPGLIELRKEKSRDAARSRRGKENYEFYELAKMLPLPAAITSQLDKASIIRLTISYLKLKEFSENGVPSWCKDPIGFQNYNAPQYFNEMFETHLGTHILQSLDGFAISTGVDGRFLYISETVSIYLGLSQVEMTGSSIFDYVHKNDHAEVEQQLGIKKGAEYASYGGYGDDGPTAEKPTVLKLGKDAPGGKGLLPGESYEGDDRAFCIRMKSTLTKRGCHFKSSGYRVILLLCHLRKKGAGQEESHTDKQTVIGMVGIGIALPPPSLHEIKLESDMFVFRTSLDLTIIHCENRISSFLDYTADELNGKSIYSLCHGQDAHKLKKSHSELIQKGQVLTPFYRILNKNAGYFWIQSCCTMVCQTKNMSDQTVICVNYIITKPEKENLILDISQIPSAAGVLGDYHAKVLPPATGAAGSKKPQPADGYELETGGITHPTHHGHHHGDGSGGGGYHLDGGASHVDHKVDLLDKAGLGKGGLGMAYGGDKKEHDYKDKLLEQREKGCSNSKHQRLKSGSPMLNAMPNENGERLDAKKSSGGKKSVNNRASVIRVLNKPSKKVLQESH
ncbi:protein trachealess isoform X1 [Anopheles gambiae]|uniref:protein trachealess isoform X1 n=1 Tax=Anopheles gambiae TaxID=7165 RepID=UPI001AACD2BB|nr:protein trachealess isoform X1 [Anopheles gambiae]XP_061505184.1 protein trachealess isoform X1 [Anopheles gambiae]XP_061505190.1 protein trachealess isoform X1 [Anopheles gambiae]